jgi:hypothetical protein
MRISQWRSALAIAIVGASTSAHAADDTAVTPYRPTVSTPAAMSATGWVEVEFGLLSSNGALPTARNSAPYAIKLAFSDTWGVRIGGEIWARDIGAENRDINGAGDTAVVLKRKFAISERSAFGLEFGVMMPTAPSGLHTGSGAADYGVNAIYSTDFGAAYHTDINYSISRLGFVASGQSRDQSLWAAALSYTVSARWGLAGELSGTRQSGADSTGQLLLAATYSPYKRVTWDFGIARGTTAATPAWSGFAGCTFLVSRL